MTVVIGQGTIHLSGRCLAEDAERLLTALQDDPTAVVDVSGAQKLHLAVIQILLAARPTMHGTPDNRFLAQHFVELLQ